MTWSPSLTNLHETKLYTFTPFSLNQETRHRKYILKICNQNNMMVNTLTICTTHSHKFYNRGEKRMKLLLYAHTTQLFIRMQFGGINVPASSQSDQSILGRCCQLYSFPRMTISLECTLRDLKLLYYTSRAVFANSVI